MTKVKVIAPFKDKLNNSVVYRPGQGVEFDDDARIKDLVKRKLVEIVGRQKEGDPVPQIFGAIDLSKPAKEVIEAVTNETDTGSLTLALEAENARENPRKTVIGAINNRLSELSE